MTVTRDATGGQYFAANAAEWTELLAGTGLANPTDLWLCDEPSGSLANSIGTAALAPAGGTWSYQQTVSGLSRKALKPGTTGSYFLSTDASMPDGSGAVTILVWAAKATAPGADTGLALIGDGNGHKILYTVATATLVPRYSVSGVGATGSSALGTGVHPLIMSAAGGVTPAFNKLTDDLETVTPAATRCLSSTKAMWLGGPVEATATDISIVYVALWVGTSMSDADRATLLNRVLNGPPVTVTSVTVAPSSSTLAPTGTVQLAATAHYSDSSTADVTATAAWTTDNGAAATVSSTGLVTGVAPGLANITATFSAQVGSAAITVAGVARSSLVPTFSILAHKAPVSGSSKMLAQTSVGVLSDVTTSPPIAAQTAGGLGVRPTPLPGDVLLTDIVTNTGGTLAMLQAGGGPIKFVVAIEGYPNLLTDADPDKAVIAHAGGDYVQALNGLYVELDVEHAIDPHDPFADTGGTCTLRIAPDVADRFGIDTHKRVAGAEAKVVNTLNRVGVNFAHPTKHGIGDVVLPWISVDHGQDFVAGDAWIGTECLALNGPGETIVSYSQRGKYSPFASAGSGGSRFAQHHRVAADSNGVWLQPVLTQNPRMWLGRLVSVWMHKVNGDGVLNSRSDAQLVYAGRIAGLSDDPETGATCIDVEHILSSLKSTTIGRDMWSGTVSDGIQLVSGRTFNMADGYTGVTGKTANALTVVDSGAVAPNQINAGYYTIAAIAAAMNAWLGSESTLGNLYGTYKWTTDVQTGDGLRTTCQWGMAAAAAAKVLGAWNLAIPAEVAAALGLQQSSNVTSIAGTTSIFDDHITPSAVVYTGDLEPLNQAIIKQLGPGGFYFQITVDNERGTLFDQYAFLPASQKPPSSGGLSWGVFLLNEKWLLIGGRDPAQSMTTLTRVVPMTAALPGARAADVLTTNFGQPSSDTNTGPMPIRQIFVLDGPTETIVNALMYSTGTPGYNHPTYDTLGFGFGVGMPGEMLGAPWERTLSRMVGADLPIVCVIDKPTQFADLIGSDLLLRRAFVTWRNGHLEIGQWTTPTGELATVALDESNKAEPASSTNPNHRAATIEDATWVKNVVKIEWNRDITQTTGSSGDEDYQNDVTLEDQRSVDDMGGATKAMTISARNTYSQFAGTGAGVEQIGPGYLAMMPVFSQPVHKATRSINVTLYEGAAPGDQCIATDAFMRDPETGERGVAARPCVLTRVRWNPGGFGVAGDAKPGDMQGEVDVLFFDGHRYGAFAPAAELDSTYNALGFTAGYKASTHEIKLAEHAYSESGEGVDACNFHVNDRVTITQIDPDDETNVLQWSRQLVTLDGSFATLDQALNGFQTSWSYRVTYDLFGQCHGLQLGRVFQAATETGRIQRAGYAFEWASTPELADPGLNEPTDYAELIAPSAFVDGAPLDAGNEQALMRTLNALLDYKATLCSPAVFNHGLSGAFTDFTVFSVSRVFLGLEQLNNSVVRYLTVAPWLASTDIFGNVGHVRVTLCRSPPTVVTGLQTYQPSARLTVQFNDTYDQQTWDVPSGASWYIGQARILTVNIKDVEGYAWLVIETATNATTYGLARCQEGPRQT